MIQSSLEFVVKAFWRSNPNKTLLASGICDSVPAFSKKGLRYRLTGSIIWKSPYGGILGAILAKIPNFRDFRVKPLLKFVRDPTVLINCHFSVLEFKLIQNFVSERNLQCTSSFFRKKNTLQANWASRLETFSGSLQERFLAQNRWAWSNNGSS